MPDLVEVGKTLDKKNARLLLVNYDLQLPNVVADDALLERIRAFLRKRAFDGECLVLRADAIPSFEEHFELGGGIPETIVLDAAGQVLARHEGKASREEIAELAKKLDG